MTIIDKKIKFFVFMCFFFAVNSVAMENLKQTFGYIEFDYIKLNAAITTVFGDEQEIFLKLLKNIADDSKRLEAEKLVCSCAKKEQGGASFRIIAAIRQWEEINKQ